MCILNIRLTLPCSLSACSHSQAYNWDMRFSCFSSMCVCTTAETLQTTYVHALYQWRQLISWKRYKEKGFWCAAKRLEKLRQIVSPIPIGREQIAHCRSKLSGVTDNVAVHNFIHITTIPDDVKISLMHASIKMRLSGYLKAVNWNVFHFCHCSPAK